MKKRQEEEIKGPEEIIRKRHRLRLNNNNINIKQIQ